MRSVPDSQPAQHGSTQLRSSTNSSFCQSCLICPMLGIPTQQLCTGYCRGVSKYVYKLPHQSLLMMTSERGGTASAAAQSHIYLLTYVRSAAARAARASARASSSQRQLLTSQPTNNGLVSMHPVKKHDEQTHPEQQHYWHDAPHRRSFRNASPGAFICRRLVAISATSLGATNEFATNDNMWASLGRRRASTAGTKPPARQL